MKNNQIYWVGFILLGMLLIFGLRTSPVQAATLTASDEASLVAAINSANANADFNIIELTADINLATTSTYNFNGATGLPIITKPLLIRGNGHTIRRSSTTQFRLLAANATQLWLEDMTLAGGNVIGSGGAIYVDGTGSELTMRQVTVGGSTPNLNISSGHGSGVYVNGSASLYQTVISYNELIINNPFSPVYGSGIMVTGTSANTLSILDSEIAYNKFKVVGEQVGGAIRVSGANAYIVNSRIHHNEASALNVYGLGMYFTGSGLLHITGSVFEYNQTPTSFYSLGRAGGLYASVDNAAYIYRSKFNNNIMRSRNHLEGGGLYLEGVGSALLDTVVIDSNQAIAEDGSAAGGGIFSELFQLTIRNSQISNNVASFDVYSGGLWSGGGGLLLTRNTAQHSALIENTTISGNQARNAQTPIGWGYQLYGEAGGLYSNVNLTLNNTTIANNIGRINGGSVVPVGSGFMIDATVTRISNSIIVGNRAYYGSNSSLSAVSNCYKFVTAAQISSGYNIYESDGRCSGIFNQTGDASASPSILSTLADNGGFSFSHAISSSPPINSGNPAPTGIGACATTDQRGALRDSQCDIGAYEFGASLPPANQAPIARDDFYVTNYDISFSAQVGWNDSDPDGDALSFHLLIFPAHGSVRMQANGTFTYTPADAAYTGDDSFSYTACDSYGNCSPASFNVFNDPSEDLPAAPTLSLTETDAFEISLEWIDNSSNESSFIIERRDNGAKWLQVDEVPSPELSYTDDSISCKFPYEYRVRAFEAATGKYSLPSNIVVVTSLDCPPPPDFAGAATGYQSIGLSWEDNLSDETRFVLQRSLDGGTTWTLLSNLNPNVTSYSNTGLTCGTSYQYRIKSERSVPAMVSDYSPVITVATNACPPLPNAPTNLIGNATGYTTIALTWRDNATDEAGYQIHISSDNGLTFTALQTVSPNQTSYNSTALSCSTSYQYKVRTYRTNPVQQYSDFSNIVTVTTNTCPPPPLAPTDLVATSAGYSSIALSWTDTNSDESSYRVEISVNGGTSWSEVTSVAANTTSYTSTILTCGTSYLYRVRAHRSSPQSLYSDYGNVATATTDACPPLPNAPSNLTVTQTAYSSLTIGWTDNAPDETNYRVERSTNGGTSWTQIANNVAANTTSYTNTSLNCNTSYMYRVRAYRATPVPQYSDYSNVITGTTTACVAPTAPSGLSLSGATASTINLSWTDNSNSESYFEISRSTNGTSWTSIDTEDANDTAYTATGLSCNTLYYFRVRATNPSGSSAYSNVASTSTTGCPPATPSNFTRTVTGTTSINLSWTDVATNETAYYLERSSDFGSTWTVLDALPANSASFANTGLSCNTAYRYRLRAYRSSDGMYSGYATTTDATTNVCPSRPATPTNVTISAVGTTALKLDWMDAATNETNYRIERSSDNWNTSTIVGELSANSNTFTDNTIVCDGNYSYKIYAYISPENVFSFSGNSNTLRIPCAPSNLVMDFSTNWSVALNWADNSSWSSNFHIEASSDGGLSWTEIAVVEDNGSSAYVISGMDCGTSRQYRVRTFSTIGSTYSGYSNLIIASTNPCTITEATCTLEQIDLSNHNGNTLGPVFLSGNGNRIAINYQDVGVVNYPNGLYLYDIPSETIVADFPNAAFGDINADGSRLVFLSTDNPLGTNADGNEEIFYWDNGSLSQLTNTNLNDSVGQPQISDDGSIVVFAGDGDVVGDPTPGSFLLVWDAVNGLRKLIPQAGVGDVALSGDGSTVAFEHNSSLSGQAGLGSRQLYRWSAADGVQLLFQLKNPQSFNGGLHALHINSDGSRILFTDNNNPLGTNPDKNDDVFLWDENTGLRQLTEANDYFGFLGSIDGSGNRVVFWTGENLDTDSTAPGSMGYYFFDEGYGYSQITSVPIGDYVTWGQSLSSDGLTAAMLASVGWNGTGDVQPYVEIFIADCTPANYLPAPSNLELSVNGVDTIDLSWTDNSLGETGFRIERSDDGGTSWEEVGQTPANSSSYTDIELACNLEYQYRVRGYRAGDNHYSDYSNVDAITITADCLPAKPTNLSVTDIAENSISLAWTDNASDETEYRLERSGDAGANWTEIAQPAADSTSYLDSDISCNMDYQYRLRAYRAGDESYSRYSNVVSSSSLDCPPPLAPTGLNVSVTAQTTVSLEWTDNATDETQYRLERSSDAGANWTEIAQPATDSTSYIDSTVLCNHSYDYRVRAYRAGDSQYSDYSNVATGATTICPPLAAPSGLTITVNSPMSISLSWVDNASDESDYRLERSTDAGASWTEVATIAANSTSYSDSTVLCDGHYDYRLRAYRAGDTQYSDYSNLATGATLACPPPAAPTSLVLVSKTETVINLGWTDNASDENGYRLERSTDAGITWTEIAQPAANSTSYSNTGLLCGTNYSYRVRAYRSTDSQYSSYSNILSSSTTSCPALAAPSNLSKSNIQEFSVDLSWLDNTNYETNYRLERLLSGGSWIEVAQLPANSTSYTDTSILCGRSYTYRVRAYQVGGNNNYSTYSSSVSVTTLACSGLNAPSNAQITKTSYTVTVSWTDNATVETAYYVERASSSSGPWTVIATLPSNSSSYTDSTVTCSTSYYYRFRAYSSVLEMYSNYNGYINSYSGFCPPTNLQSSNITTTSLTLSWTNNSAIGNYIYIDRSPTAQNSWTNVAQIAVTSTSYTNTGLSCNTGYDYRVYVYGNSIIQSDYATLTATTLACPAMVAPSGLNITGTTVSSISLAWTDNMNTETAYRVERSDDAGANWTEIVQLGANVSTYTNSSLSCGTSYQYRVRAYRSSDNQYSDYSNVLTGTSSICPAPTTPSGLAKSGSTQTSISMSWTDNASNETEYRIEQQIAGSVVWTEIAQLPANSTSYTATGLSCDTLVRYRVRAYRSSDNQYSAYSNGLLTSTNLCTPNAPTGLSVSLKTQTSIRLSWVDNANNETAYRVERSDDGIIWNEIVQLAGNSTSYTDTGLSCGTVYDYRVRAYRSSDNQYSAYSSMLSTTTSACPAPTAPTGLNITGTSDSSISLAWTDNASNESNYALERSSNAGTSWTQIALLGSNSTSYSDASVLCNTSYQYRVRAYRSQENLYSTYSNVATGTTTACPPPTSPSALTVASVGHTNINLSWTDNSNETVFRLERSADSGTTWAEIAQPAANATSYSDTTASCTTSYDYRIRAYRAGDAQFSDYSNVATGTTDVCITLNAPSNIQLTASTETSLSLSWTDNSSNESGYEVERSLDGTNWSLMSSLPADSTSYTDSGLTCSTGYQYRVRSQHLGSGTYSAYATSTVFTTVSCPALIASVLSNTGSTANSISLSWTVDNSGTSFTLAYYNGASWVNLGIFPASTTSYTHNGLSCGTSYPYQVTTLRAGDGTSVTSTAFSAITAACPPLAAPNAPVVLNTEPALVSLQIPALPATATSMSLERSTDGISWTNLGAVSTNYIDTAVICGSSYQYRLVATRSSDGVTSTSATAVALTDACPIPTVLGVYRGGLWVFVDSNNTASPVNSFNFGDSSWQPLVGDWDGDGIDGVGIYRNGEFALRNIASADSPENRFNFGTAEAGWQAIVGDWDGNGTDTVGLYKDGLFILSNDNINSQYRFNFGGGAGWQALAGDWDGNGADGIGLYKDGMWMLAEDVNNPGGTTIMISYGPAQAGWTAIVGDWNGDGRDSIGLYSNGLWRMRVSNIHDTAENSVSFGQNGDIPLAIFEN